MAWHATPSQSKSKQDNVGQSKRGTVACRRHSNVCPALRSSPQCEPKACEASFPCSVKPSGPAEDQDEYLAENVFWVPKDARWSHLQANAKQPTIGKLIDDAIGRGHARKA